MLEREWRPRGVEPGIQVTFKETYDRISLHLLTLETVQQSLRSLSAR
jgi:hypothetical protein